MIHRGEGREGDNGAREGVCVCVCVGGGGGRGEDEKSERTITIWHHRRFSTHNVRPPGEENIVH